MAILSPHADVLKWNCPKYWIEPAGLPDRVMSESEWKSDISRRPFFTIKAQREIGREEIRRS
jgi:hypothetical protein